MQDVIFLNTINYLILQLNVQLKEQNMKIHSRDLWTVFSKLVVQKLLQVISKPVI